MTDLSRPIFDGDFKSDISFYVEKSEIHKKIMVSTRKFNLTYKICAVSSPSIPMISAKLIS